MSFRDIADKYGKQREFVRSLYRRYKDKNDSVDISDSDTDISVSLDNKLTSIENLLGSDRIAIQSLREEKRQIEQAKSALGRTSVLAEYIQEALSNLDVYKRSPFKEIVVKNHTRVGIVQVSDFHDGVIVKPINTNGHNEYNPQVMEKRMYKYLEEVVMYGQMYGIEKLYIYGLGDFIEHDSMRSNQLASIAYPVVEQMLHFEEFLYNWLVDLSRYFVLEFDGVGGNHDRNNGDKNKDIAENNFSSLILHMCKLRLADNHPNITFNYTFNNQSIIKNILGYWILGKHGHDDQGSKVERLKDNIVMDGKDITYFLYGHLHNFKVETGSRGKKAIGNGCVIGSDDYGRNLVHSNANASQNLLIVEKNKGIIAYHEIDLQSA